MSKNRQKRPQKTITWYSFRKPLTFFIIVLNIMVVAFGEPGLDIKPLYLKNRQKSSKKAQKIYNMIFIQKTPRILHPCAQHRDYRFGGPGLHIKPWYCQWDYVFESFFYLQIGCGYTYFTIVNHQFFTSFYKSWQKISNLTHSQIKH